MIVQKSFVDVYCLDFISSVKAFIFIEILKISKNCFAIFR